MPVIEYFFSAHSAYAYLGSARLREIAAAAGATVVHKPYDLRRAVDALAVVPISKRSREHIRYFFQREIDRWAQYRNAPVCGYRPTYHDHDIRRCNGMLIAGLQAGVEIQALTHAMLEAHWRDDADLADPDTLARLARQVGVEPEPLLAAALGDAAQAEFERNTDEAIARAVFGSPTYIVDGDPFYGQDHLELVERALQQPFAHNWQD